MDSDKGIGPSVSRHTEVGGVMIFNVKPCSNELGEILKEIDDSIRQLHELSELNRKSAQILGISQKVEWMLERTQKGEWEGIHTQLQELIYYLELCCFSWAKMNGDHFHVYLEEVNQRYRMLLWALYTFHKQRKKHTL